MLPRLLHITPIVIRQKNTSNTLYDHNAREPIGRPNLTSAVTLEGQVMWESQKVYMTDSGVVNNTRGYVLFRQFDLSKAGITLNQGDKIIKFGTGIAARNVEYYLCGFDYRGHYAEQGGHSLVKAWFQEKQPASR